MREDSLALCRPVVSPGLLSWLLPHHTGLPCLSGWWSCIVLALLRKQTDAEEQEQSHHHAPGKREHDRGSVPLRLLPCFLCLCHGSSFSSSCCTFPFLVRGGNGFSLQLCWFTHSAMPPQAGYARPHARAAQS